MTGLELARGFYDHCGAPMLHEQFPALEDKIAVGLVGSGSECFGYDDEISRDHDFEPGFCLFLPDESLVSRAEAFALERAYARLPKEYGGFLRSTLAPVGGQRHGVLRTADFFRRYTGLDAAPSTWREWLSIPDWALAEATNGAVFRDDMGQFSALRAALSEPPEDVRRKKLAGQLLLMAQSGQYNYPRCLRRGDKAAAQLAAIEFTAAAMAAAFALERRYMPYYKWRFRALRALPAMAALAEPLEEIVMGRASEALIERVCAAIGAALQDQGLSALLTNDLERHAYAVNDRIADISLRNESILAAV